jgi:hypothetical protein
MAIRIEFRTQWRDAAVSPLTTRPEGFTSFHFFPVDNLAAATGSIAIIIAGIGLPVNGDGGVNELSGS